MPKEHCAATVRTEAGHCEDHSGQLMWMRGIAALLLLSAGLLSYSVFWQAPTIQTAIAKENARMDGQINLVKRDVEGLKSDITDLRSRVYKLEK